MIVIQVDSIPEEETLLQRDSVYVRISLSWYVQCVSKKHPRHF